MSDTLWVQESGVNATEGYGLYGGRDVIYDSECETPGELYRQIVRSREYGRCVSKCYIDTESGPVQIGWVFQKRANYDRSEETYLHETWFTVIEEPKPRPALVPVRIGKG